MDLPRIVTEPPGPAAKRVVEEDKRYLMQSFVRWYPLVVKRASGSIVEDVDGNLYIDMNAGIAVASTGHTHPKVVEAIKRQASLLLHYSLTDFLYEEPVKLAKKLVDITPGDGAKKVFFTNSGAESVEAAIKIARYYHGGRRPYLLAFIGAFHGRTMGALSLTASKPVQRRGFSPLIWGPVHVPYPYPYRCAFKVEPDECGEATISYIEEWVFGKYVPPEETAAIVIEPIAGEGGYIVPPDDFLPKLRRLADRHDILLVVDEVQTGMGRTGKWFAVEHWNVEPDIITLAKGIASGLPLGAVVGREEVMKVGRGGHASTFGGNPVSCAAANATIDIIERENLLENASKVGNYILSRFRDMAEEIPLIGDIRGKGLMIGVELVRNRDTKEPAKKELENIIQKAFKRGVLVIGAGLSTLRLSPPLTITTDLAEKALDILEDLLKQEWRNMR